MNNTFEKKYPRIFSLSTIGLIHHYNIDYIFHPFRTDFSGEAGIGKSTIANLLQLIFVGSKHFKPASNTGYKISGYVWQPKIGKQKNFGYAFMNVEVEKNRYLVVGVFLKAGSNNVEHFILQNGVDWERLTYFEKPILHKELIEDEKIISLSELQNFVKQRFCCDTFDIRKFQEILYNNEILPFDLFQNEENTSKYAQILKSFSAGKDIHWDNSDKLKEFLFGNDTTLKIKQAYETEIANIEYKYNTSFKNDRDIENIQKRIQHIHELIKFKNLLTEAEKDYRIAKNVYWFFQKKKIEESEIKIEENRLWQLTTEIVLLESEYYIHKMAALIKTKSEIENKQIEIQNLKAKLIEFGKIDFETEKQRISNEHIEKLIKYNNVQLITKFLVDYKSTERLRSEYKFNIQKEEINLFENYLNEKSTKITDYLTLFNSSKWAVNYNTGELNYEDRTNHFNEQIAQLKALKAFSNFKQDNSFIKWAVESQDSYSNIHESVIAHFFELYLTKPQNENGQRFIPDPEILLKAINNENIQIEETGFWINLNGVNEFVGFRERYFLDDKTKNVIETISRYAEQTDQEIQNAENEKLELNALRDLTQAYPNRSLFDFYPNRIAISNIFKNDLFHQVTTDVDLENKIRDYDNRVEIIQSYNEAKKANEDIIKHEIEYLSINEKINLTSSFLTENILDAIIPTINVINEKIDKLENLIHNLRKDIRFDKLQTDLSNVINGALDKTVEIDRLLLEKKIDEDNSRLKNDELSLKLKAAQTEFDESNALCILFNDSVNFTLLKDKYNGDPEITQKKTLEQCNRDYLSHCEFLSKTYLGDSSNSHSNDDFQFLLKEILPYIFKKEKIEESTVVDTINEYLVEINEKIKEINSVFVQILTKLFQDVIDAYNGYKLKYDKLKAFFIQNDSKITGGNSVKLTFENVTDYPIDFLNNIKVELNSQMIYTKGSLFQHLPSRNEIDNIIMDKYHEYASKRDISVVDLLDPLNYFKMEFGIKLGDGKKNIGSTGQKYAAIALLCIAQISQIYKNRQNEPPKGIRYMPIDDAQDLGSNYDMLYSIAANEDFQLITFSITPLDNLEIGNQNWYMLNENPEEQQINNPPFAILSSNSETIYNWDKYINNIYS